MLTPDGLEELIRLCEGIANLTVEEIASVIKDVIMAELGSADPPYGDTVRKPIEKRLSGLPQKSKETKS